MAFLLHLLHLAWLATFDAMGTTPLGQLVSCVAVFIPAIRSGPRKALASLRGTWLATREGFYAVAILWALVFTWQFCWAVPHAMRQGAAEIQEPQSNPSAALTVHKLFRDDFPHATIDLATTITNRRTGEKSNIETRVVLDMPANSKFIVFYVPMMGADRAYPIIAAFSSAFTQILYDADSRVEMGMGFPGEEMMRSKDLKFSRRIFVYYEDDLTLQQRAQLENVYLKNRLAVIFRGSEYASSRTLGTPHKLE